MIHTICYALFGAIGYALGGAVNEVFSLDRYGGFSTTQVSCVICAWP